MKKRIHNIFFATLLGIGSVACFGSEVSAQGPSAESGMVGWSPERREWAEKIADVLLTLSGMDTQRSFKECTCDCGPSCKACNPDPNNLCDECVGRCDECGCYYDCDRCRGCVDCPNCECTCAAYCSDDENGWDEDTVERNWQSKACGRAKQAVEEALKLARKKGDVEKLRKKIAEWSPERREWAEKIADILLVVSAADDDAQNKAEHSLRGCACACAPDCEDCGPGGCEDCSNCSCLCVKWCRCGDRDEETDPQDQFFVRAMKEALKFAKERDDAEKLRKKIAGWSPERREWTEKTADALLALAGPEAHRLGEDATRSLAFDEAVSEAIVEGLRVARKKARAA